MDALLARINAFLASHQQLLAFALLGVLALQILHVFTLPHGIEMGIVFALGVLGVARPTETAAKIAGEVASARGGASVAALLAALAGTVTFAPMTDPNPVEASDTVDDVIDLVEPVDIDVIDVEAKDVG